MVEYKVNLIKVSVDSNNNKFWNIEYNDCKVTRSWGRVGSKISSKTETMSLSKAKSLVATKIKEGYREVDLVTTNVSTSTSSNKEVLYNFMKEITSSSEILDVLNYCIDTNIHQILSSTQLKFDEKSGLFSTPLGVVTKKSIEEARSLLIGIMNTLDKKLVEQYLTLIPQKVGSKLNIDDLFGSSIKIKYQQDLLDSLEASVDMVVNQSSTDTIKIPNPFSLNIELVTDSNTISYLKNKFESNIDQGHESSKLKLVRSFHLNIKSMTENARFNIGEGVHLWHGTRVGNLLSIFKNGMKIIPSGGNNVTGRMFGDGLYFSNTSTKALNYSIGTWNKTGSGNKNKYYALVCEVFMGNTYEPESTQGPFPKPGYDSTFAKKSKCNLRNNEMIVYNTNQVIPKYLVEFEF